MSSKGLEEVKASSLTRILIRDLSKDGPELTRLQIQYDLQAITGTEAFVFVAKKLVCGPDIFAKSLLQTSFFRTKTPVALVAS